MKRPQHSSYPMPVEGAEELARELSEFGYRETTDPDEAERRTLLQGREMGRRRAAHRGAPARQQRPRPGAGGLRHREEAPAARPPYAAPGNPCVATLAAELSSTYVSQVSLRILGRDRPRFTYRVRPIRFRADHEQRQ